MRRLLFAVGATVMAASLLAGCQKIERPLTGRYDKTEPVSRPYVLEPKTIMADELTISYMEAGEGPHVVLIHGGVIPMDSLTSLCYEPVSNILFAPPLSQSVLHTGAVATADSWNYNIQELATRYHVVALDLPGFGGSDKPDIKYKREDFVLYLAAFMAAKGIDEAALVGHGLGGVIAIDYALANPEKVNKLVLVDSYGAWGVKHPYLFFSPLNWRLPVRYWQREKAAKVNILMPLYRKAMGNWRKPGEAAVRMTLSQKVNKGHNQNYVADREDRSGDFLQKTADFKMKYVTTKEVHDEVLATHLALHETRRSDLTPRFGELEMPVLVIRGAHDPAVSIEQAKYMETTMPNARLIEYEYSGHYPMVEESGRFNQDVSYFLSGAEMASAE